MEEILIENVRIHEVLYNQSSHDYRDQRIRQEAWEEIGRELKIPADKAKQLWDKLRRCYNNARNRRLSARSGQATKNIPAWKFEEQMSFLLPYLESRKTCSNFVSDIDNADAQECQVNPEREVQVNPKIEVSDVEEYLEETQARRNEMNPQENAQRGKNMNLLHQIKKHKQCSESTAAVEIVHIMQENANPRKRKYENQKETKKSSLENMDDIDLYFLSMAKMTKKLPKYEQTCVKLAVSKAVFEAEKRSFARPPSPQETRASTPLSSPQNYCDNSSNFEDEYF